MCALQLRRRRSDRRARAPQREPDVSFTNSAALQMRSIKALMLRRIRTRYAGSRAGYVWAFVEPICWVFVLKFALAHGNQRPPVGTSFEVFFATGVVLMRTWRTATGAIVNSIAKTKRQMLPSLHRLDVAYATWLLEMATGAIVLILILAGLGIFGFHVMPADMLTCIAAFAGTSVFTIAFALAFSALMTVAPGLKHFQGLLLMVMFITSGFAMLVDRMPPQLRELVAWNPLVHCVEWFREGFYPGYECATLDREYLFTVTVACLLLGLAGERAFRRRSAAARR
jgi:capsular polysaccharide transport system permease protein